MTCSRLHKWRGLNNITVQYFSDGDSVQWGWLELGPGGHVPAPVQHPFPLLLGMALIPLWGSDSLSHSLPCGRPRPWLQLWPRGTFCLLVTEMGSEMGQ